MAKLICPNCGGAGSSSKKIPNGAKVLCAYCKILFIYKIEPAFGEDHDIDAILGAALKKQADLEKAAKRQMNQTIQNRPANRSNAGPQQTTKRCNYCGEVILTIAKKCKHCGEFLDDSPLQDGHQISIYEHPRRTRSTQQVSHSGIAALLSLIIPGAGQMYRGRVGMGIGWLIFTTIGYVIGYGFFIVPIPGMILHLICIMNTTIDN